MAFLFFFAKFTRGIMRIYYNGGSTYEHCKDCSKNET